jgi:hypothetical protein
MQTRFEASDEYMAANRDFQAAQRQYDAAIAQARKALKNSPEYNDAVAAKARAARDVQVVQATAKQDPNPTTTPDPVPQKLVDAAQKKLDTKTDVDQMETEWALRDPAAKEAKAKLDEASARLGSLRAKFDASVLTSPEGQVPRRDYDAATTR